MGKRVWFITKGDPPRTPTNPDFPNGVLVDMTRGQKPCCEVPVDYPASAVGVYVIKCDDCGMQVAITAAGRPDDPVGVVLPCKSILQSIAKH